MLTVAAAPSRSAKRSLERVRGPRPPGRTGRVALVVAGRSLRCGASGGRASGGDADARPGLSPGRRDIPPGELREAGAGRVRRWPTGAGLYPGLATRLARSAIGTSRGELTSTMPALQLALELVEFRLGTRVQIDDFTHNGPVASMGPGLGPCDQRDGLRFEHLRGKTFKGPASSEGSPGFEVGVG